MAPFTWWPFLLLIFFLGIFTKVYPLTAFAVILTVLSIIASLWQQRALLGVNYRRKLYYQRGFPGESISLQVAIENRKFLPLSWIRVEDLLPTRIAPQDESILKPTHTLEFGLLVNLYSLRWFEGTRRAFELFLRTRGVYRLGPVKLESGDMFGLFEQVREDESLDYITVFPDPVPYQNLNLPTEDPFGDRRSHKRLYEDPNRPMGIRDYHPEDEFRRIHWPATAHTGKLQVKVYQPIAAKVLVLCLNVSTLTYYWEGTYPELLEHLIRVTTALTIKAIDDGYQVGLISNGCLAHADQPFRVPPGRSPKQLTRLLETLAGVTPFTTSPFEKFLMIEAPRLPYGATLVIVTGLLNQPLIETVFRLRQRGRRITLLSFARDVPPKISGVQVLHQPFHE